MNKMMTRKWILLTSKRRLYMLLKLFIIVIMFGLYIFFLMQESMSVIEKSKFGGGSGLNTVGGSAGRREHLPHSRYVRIGKPAASAVSMPL